jgi:hypothetical protein
VSQWLASMTSLDSHDSQFIICFPENISSGLTQTSRWFSIGRQAGRPLYLAMNSYVYNELLRTYKMHLEWCVNLSNWGFTIPHEGVSTFDYTHHLEGEGHRRDVRMWPDTSRNAEEPPSASFSNGLLKCWNSFNTWCGKTPKANVAQHIQAI